MSAPPPRPWNFARLQKRPRYASWPSFGSAHKTRAFHRDLKLSGPILTRIAAHLHRRGAAAAMLPMRDFRLRRRRLAGSLGQPSIFFWLAALLVQAAAQPHAREDHAQHIMNQARANQKASRPVCNSRVGRARARDLPRRRRIDGVQGRRRRGANNTRVTNAGARNSSASGSAGSMKREKELQKRTT